MASLTTLALEVSGVEEEEGRVTIVRLKPLEGEARARTMKGARVPVACVEEEGGGS